MTEGGRYISIPKLDQLHGDEDRYYITPRQVRLRRGYEYDEERGLLTIEDPIWDRVEIGRQPGDGLLIELYNHPLVQRTMDVEQLTLPQKYSTMPGSTDLPRYEHLWGSVAFIRKMVECSEAEGRIFDQKEKLVLQLRALLHDLGQMAGSHLGDWLLQGFGGAEDYHDISLNQLLEIGGINELLRKYDIDPAEVLSINKHDWIENPSPDLCVDRVDYGVREITRWIDPYPYNWLHDPISHFQLVGDRLVMKDKKSAKFFGVAFGLLATEHWSHPTHRLQLHLFADLVKGGIVENGSPVLSRYGIRHPADFLYTTDTDIFESTQQVGILNNDLHAVMLDIARDQRRCFAWGREDEIENFIRTAMRDKMSPFVEESRDYLPPLESRTWKGEYAGTKPPNLEFVPVAEAADVKDYGRSKSTLDIFMPPLKPRAVDPLFFTSKGGVVRLSRSDKYFAQLLEQHKALQAQAYVARIHLAPDFATELKGKLSRVQQEWDRLFLAPRADPETMSRALGDIAWHATLHHRY